MWVSVTLMALVLVTAVKVDLRLLAQAARGRREVAVGLGPETAEHLMEPETPEDLLNQFHEFISRIRPDDFES